MPAVEQRAGVANGLSYTEYRANDGDGTAVLLPSLGLSRRSWHEAALLLCEHMRVISIDPPGHGDSPVRPFFVTIADQSDLLADMLAELGIAEVIAIGNSMGAAIALDLAVRRPEMVTALGLVGAFALGNEQSRREWLKSRSESMLTPEGGIRPMDVEFITRLFGGKYRVDLHRYILEEYIRCARSMNTALWSLYAYDIVAAVEGVTVPALVAYGEHDYLRETATALIRTQRPDFDEAVVPNGGHLTPVDEPAALAGILIDWLADVARTRAAGRAGGKI